MKGHTFKATLEWLQITPSYRRPRVSNDNAVSEAMFRTCKHRLEYPVDGFAEMAAAQTSSERFVNWYNQDHRYSGIRYVTPDRRHCGEDIEILDRRDTLYKEARARQPECVSGDTRDWSPVGAVTNSCPTAGHRFPT